MTHKKRQTIGNTIVKIVMLIPTLFGLITKISTLIGFEARLAGRSIVVLLILSLVVGSLLTTIWLCVLAILSFYLISWHWSWVQSFVFIAMLNILLLILIGFIMSRVKENLTFPILRKQLRHMMTREDS